MTSPFVYNGMDFQGGKNQQTMYQSGLIIFSAAIPVRPQLKRIDPLVSGSATT
jgi:hypothetical protein